MKRPALQNKHVVVYEWLFGPEKFSGLSRNGSLDWHDMKTNPFPSREEPALSQVGKWCDLLQWALQPRSQGPLLPVPWSEREREGEDPGNEVVGPLQLNDHVIQKWSSGVSVFSHCCTADLPVFMVRRPLPRPVPFYLCFCSNGIMCSSDVISLYTDVYRLMKQYESALTSYSRVLILPCTALKVWFQFASKLKGQYF